MINLKQSSIAIIGDEDLVNGLRLAGMSTYYIVKNGQDVGDQVKKILDQLVNDSNVNIIVIQEDYAEYSSPVSALIRESKRLTPIIVEVPSKYGTKYGDVTDYYKAHIRGFIGFDVEI